MEQYGADINTTINALNATGADTIRIVVMGGPQMPDAVHIALEGLVKGWDQPWDRKKVLLVALNETAECDYLNLCRVLCLKKICSHVQLYRASDYNHLGFFHDIALSCINLIN